MAMTHSVRDDFFDVTTITSPACMAQERKDQDRAVWFPVHKRASLADGVSSSPFAVKAARNTVALSPILTDPETIANHLSSIAEVLFAHRREAMGRVLTFPPNTSESMRPILEEAARQRLKDAFQTTLITAAFAPAATDTRVLIVRCGDSAFFAFSADDELLMATPDERILGPRVRDGVMPFGPGGELLVKIEGTLSHYLEIADRLEIRFAHAENWFLCRPLDSCTPPRSEGTKSLCLCAGELLVVPGFAVDRRISWERDPYRRIRFSAVIRRVSDNSPEGPFTSNNSVTAVLPDHVQCGQYVVLNEVFPHDAHFILASDGFYGCFGDAQEMWGWLMEHHQSIQDRRAQRVAMAALHQRLHATNGDDDMSFIWVRPRGWSPSARAYSGILHDNGRNHD